MQTLQRHLNCLTLAQWLIFGVVDTDVYLKPRFESDNAAKFELPAALPFRGFVWGELNAQKKAGESPARAQTASPELSS